MHARFGRWLSPLMVAGVTLSGACHPAPATLPPSPAGATPETVLLRLHVRAGQAWRSRHVTEGFMHFGPGEPPSGDSARPMMRMTQFVTESVTAVSGDTMTVAFITDSSRSEMPGLHLPGTSLDSLSLRALTLTTTLDSRGRVISMQVQGPAQFEGRLATIRMMLPGGDPSAEAGRGMLARLPDGPVRVGDTWADSSGCPPALGCTGKAMVATYRLERIETRGAHRLAVISSDIAVPATLLEVPMRVSSGPMHTVSELELDLDGGWFADRSTTMTGSAHTEMGDVSMRMVTHQTPVESVPSAGPGAEMVPPAPSAPPILIRRAPIPSPTTLAELLALYRQAPQREPLPAQLPQCRLPDVSPAGDWVTLEGPDNGFGLRLPPGWRARPPGDSGFGLPATVLEDSAGSRIRVALVVGGRGRPFLAKLGATGPAGELPHMGPCQVGLGPSGSFWTLYAPDSGAASGPLARYNAFGDVITSAGKRYNVSVGASTAEERDRLVRIVSGAAQPGRAPGGA